ncbi:hypothetical protein LA14_1928 [Lactobacillus acidophilus La-14]|nr:hypothetical protein LA14_1928 [Lactobacillus acidophilus La-14]
MIQANTEIKKIVNKTPLIKRRGSINQEIKNMKNIRSIKTEM